MKNAIKGAIRSAGFKLSRSNERHDIYGEAKLYRKLYSDSALRNRRFYNLGSGDWRHPFWTNVDYSSEYYGYANDLIDIHWDIASGASLNAPDGQAELCYCSHTVEHLLNEHVDHLFREAFRILKPGGVLRVTCPNMEQYYQAWKRRDVFFYYHYDYIVPFGDETGSYTRDTMSIWLVNELATQLVQSVYQGHSPRYTDAKELDQILQSGPMGEVFDRLCSEVDFSVQQRVPGNHVNWWTNRKLCAAMTRAGFSETVVTVAGGSVAPPMRDRSYFDKQNPTFSLFVDAIKA
jgi:SAM-dependent methyltransferase